jgi:thioester reductase-like protein
LSGTHLLSELLRQTDVGRIFCITRYKECDAFLSAIEASVMRYRIDMLMSDVKSKVELIFMDLTKDDDSILSTLGEYEQEIDVIHHLACDTAYGEPKEYFQPWINATKALVQYCMNPKYPKYFYAVGSCGHVLVDKPYTADDAYWVK